MDKKNKNPEIRFKGFTEDWVDKLLADEVNFFTGLTYSPSNVVKIGGTLVLRSSNVKNSQIVLSDNVFVESEVVNCENVIVGDIIIVVRNGSRNLIGKHALIKKDMPNTVIGAFMTGIHSKQSDFINSLLDTNQFEKEIEKNLGATINQITTGALKKMSFWFPNDDEQKQIGTFFQNLDSLITLHQKKHDKLIILKKAMLVKMFPKKGALVPEIRFKGFTEDWEAKPLNEITIYKSSSLSVGDAKTDAKYKLYDANKVIGFTNENVQQSEYISIIKDGSGVGRVRLMPKNTSFIGTMGAICSTEVNIDFLFCCLVKTDFRKHITGATIPHIYYSNYGNEMYFIPNKAEQIKIGNYFRNLNTQIELHKTQLDKLNTIKKACFTKMFVAQD